MAAALAACSGARLQPETRTLRRRLRRPGPATYWANSSAQRASSWDAEQESFALSVDRVLIDGGRRVLDELEALGGVAAHQALDEVLHRLAILVLGWEPDLEPRAG